MEKKNEEFYITLYKDNDASNDFIFHLPERLYFPGGQWKCGLVEFTLSKPPTIKGARIETDFVNTSIISHKKRQMLRYIRDAKRQFNHIMYIPIIVPDVEVIKIQVVNNNTNTLCEGNPIKTTSFVLHFKSS